MGVSQCWQPEWYIIQLTVHYLWGFEMSWGSRSSY